MIKWIVLAGIAALIGGWWVTAAPRDEIRCCVADSMVFDPATEEAINAVDRTAEFAAGLEVLSSNLPPYDDAVFLDGGATALVTAHDGRIWAVNVAENTAEPIADVPLMAWGIHEVPGDSTQVYFCAAGSYDQRQSGEAPGLYRLDLGTRSVEPLTLVVPDTKIDLAQPIVFADDDPNAPEIRGDSNDGASRPIAVCDNLDVSDDGNRIYFSEPFAYQNATLDDAIDEALALAPNGRLWRYDLTSGSTRLIAQGFHFINGVLFDPHPGQVREESVIVTQTSLFRVTRLYVNGPKAGRSEVVIDSLPGTPDGMDRDADGRVWLAMFVDRGKLLTWVHENAWIKPLVMRLPTKLLLAQPQRTGVVVLSPDGSEPLYSAFYEGPELFSIASAVPAASGVYLANVALDDADRDHNGIQRLQWPPELP